MLHTCYKRCILNPATWVDYPVDLFMFKPADTKRFGVWYKNLDTKRPSQLERFQDQILPGAREWNRRLERGLKESRLTVVGGVHLPITLSSGGGFMIFFNRPAAPSFCLLSTCSWVCSYRWIFVSSWIFFPHLNMFNHVSFVFFFPSDL